MTTTFEAESELDLRDYLAVLRRRWRVIALVTLVTATIAVGLSLAESAVYRASTDILVESGTARELFDPVTGQLNDPDRELQNEIEFISSNAVADAVGEELGFPASISASARADADVIVLSANDGDAERAAEIANQYAQTYLELRRSGAVTDFQQTAEVVEANLAEVITELTTVEGRLTEIAGQLFAPGPDTPVGELQQEEATLQARNVSLQEERVSLESSLRQLELSGDLAQEGRATIIAPATAPSSPISPKPARNAVLALVVGLMLGVGVAFLRDYLDDSVRTKEQLESAIDGAAPVLGLLPQLASWRQVTETHIVVMEEPTSPAAEAYRSLRTSVSFLGIDRDLKIIQLTSARSAEGKTTTSANLAVVMARAGRRVLLVDCDLRKPRLHRFFGLPNSKGITTALLTGSLEGTIQVVKQVPNLHLMASGQIPPDPAELLASDRTAKIFADLRATYDMIVVDSPPVLPVTDAIVLSRIVDATLLVTSVTKSSKRDVHRAGELMAQVQAPLMGAVLNSVSSENTYGYTYGYYGVEEQAAPPAPPPADDAQSAPEPADDDPTAPSAGPDDDGEGLTTEVDTETSSPTA